MTCSHGHTLAALRRADLVAKRALREAENDLRALQVAQEAKIILAMSKEHSVDPPSVKALGVNETDQKRTMLVLLAAQPVFNDAVKRVRGAEEQAAVCAVDLQIALDERDERRLAARERLTDVLAVAFGVPAVSADDEAVDATQDELADALVGLSPSAVDAAKAGDWSIAIAEANAPSDEHKDPSCVCCEIGDTDGCHDDCTELKEFQRLHQSATVSDEALAAGEGYDAAMATMGAEA